MSQPGFSELQMTVSFNDKDWVEFQLSKQVIIIVPLESLLFKCNFLAKSNEYWSLREIFV